jgi:hypothetical protein
MKLKHDLPLKDYFDKMIRDLRKDFSIINRSSKYRSGEAQTILSIHISSLTGIVNLSDYLVASIERKPCSEREDECKKKGFAYNVLSDEEIERVEKYVSKCITI